MITLKNEPQVSQLDITKSVELKSYNEYFEGVNLSVDLQNALAEMGFIEPSEIQKAAIPAIFKNEDIIAMAPTGSGKTATFAIPIIERLDTANSNIQALVMCPTRELAIQCHREFEKMGKYIEGFSVVSVYGGQNIDRQLNALKRNPQIIVATPGRLMDHYKRGSIKFDNVKTVVLDEADEMLDMGFREDIYEILNKTPKDRQTILFSATMAKDILELTKKIQKSPSIVDVTDDLKDIPNIEQQYFEVVEKDKIELLIRLLQLHSIGLSLVFCNTKTNVDRVVEKLKEKGFFADAIHGDMNQNQREKVMQGFRKGSVKVLVATDVAGRGIDVKNIEAVFNFDLPRDDEDYIHRIGRTARAGKSGNSFTFVTKRQVSMLKRIERANGIKIVKQELPTVEELEKVNCETFLEKIKNIIKSEELSSFKATLNEHLTVDYGMEDIAAALYKYATSKEGKKINKDFTFSSVQNDTSEEKQHRKRSFRGRRRNANKFENALKKENFSSKKKSNRRRKARV
ncbi:MAG: DEAD/DEAH box helicase [Clostridiaceae bacterium]|nr:DEAD/DEAH box helicase [Clostridiaceae bacterium]